MSINKLLLSTVILLFAATKTQAQFAVNGYVSEKKSSEKMVNAYILAPYLKKGTATNNYGYFSLSLPTDTATLLISFVGFSPVQIFWDSKKDSKVLNVELQKLEKLSEEVVVVGNKIQKNVESSQMSKVTIPIEQIKRMPKFLGEADVLKSLQMLPGVSQGTEGTSGVIVRGGTPDQNLILLDGTPVYNASHLFGIFSTFNTDAIKNVELYKGGFPARYGGRLSSVIDMVMKDGDKSTIHGEGGIGILAAKFQLEGPIKKNKSSFLVSARRSYADLLAQPFIKKSRDETGIDNFFAFFYDFNAKLNFDLTQKDKLFFSLYSGEDKLRVNIKETNNNETFKLGTQVGWGNLISTVRWNHILNKKLFANTTVNYTRYRFLTKISEQSISSTYNESFAAKYISGIYDVGAKVDFDYRPNYKNSIKFGAGILNHTFTPGATSIKITATNDPSLDTAFNNQKQNSIELTSYVEDDIIVNDKLKINAGVHIAAFKSQNKFYPNVQPRISGKYSLSSNASIKATYTRMNQYIHLLTNNGSTLPTDLWVPSTDKIKPMKSDQFAIGFAKNIKNKYEFTAEAYYKTMNGVIEYKDGASFLNSSTANWDVKVDQGKGKSYGLEMMIQKTSGRTTGWIGYTLNWSNRTFDEINFGKTFWYKYDRRHDFEITIIHKISKRWDFSANFLFQSPQPFTLPTGQYQGLGQSSPYQSNYYNNNQSTIDIYSGRNEFRLLPYHRMDASFTYHKQKKRHEKIWNFSFYNIYNRANPFIYELDRFNSNGKAVLNGYPLLPFIPSVSYGFKF